MQPDGGAKMQEAETEYTSTEIQVDEASLTELYDALADDRRRTMLSILTGRSTPVDVTTLARTVAARETGMAVDDVADETAERVEHALYHVHLPKLADADVVSYDRDRSTVELANDGVRELPLTDPSRARAVPDSETLRTAAVAQLRSALEADDDDQNRYHVRQALQLLRFD